MIDLWELRFEKGNRYDVSADFYRDNKRITGFEYNFKGYCSLYTWMVNCWESCKAVLLMEGAIEPQTEGWKRKLIDHKEVK